MVTPEHERFMSEYVANFGGVYELKDNTGSCDRCSKRHGWRYIESLKRWMVPGVDGAPPYLCIDCARHYGLVW